MRVLAALSGGVDSAVAWAAVGSGLTGAALLASLRAAGLGEGLLGAVTEVL